MLSSARIAGNLIRSVAILGLTAGTSAHAQSMSGEEIVEAMQAGGYVLVMNAAQNAEPPADGGGRGGRGGGFGGGRGGGGGGGPRLTDYGEGTVIGMRFALREFRIDIDTKLAPSAAPAQATAAQLEFGSLEIVDELEEAAASSAAEWLRNRAAQRPAEGSNTIIVTQAANIQSAFGNAASNLEDGEALLIGAEGQVLGRIEIEEWSRLATS